MELYAFVRGYRDAVDTPGYDARYRKIRLRLPLHTRNKSLPVSLVPAGNSDFTIRVSGTPGTKYDGAYPSPGFINPVNGVVPAQYTVTDETASVSLKKQGGPGVLKVQILRAGQVVAEAQTSAVNGTVSVATK